MRGFWTFLALLIAAAGGGAAGYALNIQYGPRTSLHPLRVAPQIPFEVRVRRIVFVAVSSDEPEPRRSMPGIVDITPPEALIAAGITPRKSSPPPPPESEVAAETELR